MYEAVLKFWFEEIDPKQWWVKDVEFDALIAERFSDIHKQAAACELYTWRANARGRLAEVIVLDQFSRNMFRGSSKSFAFDPLALALAQEAVALGMDAQLETVERSFLYLPYMHSESLPIHDQALNLYSQQGLENNYDFEVKHRDIIVEFGRYPHRNEILGRESTAEEIAFLKTPNSSF
jgi:uncharacterized protein (DUF924 family)